MDISAFETRLNELLNEINDLPAEQGKKFLSQAQKTKLYNQKFKQTSASSVEPNTETLQDSLDHLRLTVKYLLFDLEATRRENKYLRKMLENSEE
jgi:regulator of replication initiation timing